MNYTTTEEIPSGNVDADTQPSIKPRKRRKMKDSVDTAAMKADGKRKCDKCPFHPCTLTQFKFCTGVFREGFRKGAAWKQKQLKKHENP